MCKVTPVGSGNHRIEEEGCHLAVMSRKSQRQNMASVSSEESKGPQAKVPGLRGWEVTAGSGVP